MGRFKGDNGKPDDTGIKDLISPFRADRSALMDAVKLSESGFSSRKALIVYGFDDTERPLDDAVGALETLLRQRTIVRTRHDSSVALFVCVADVVGHPVATAQVSPRSRRKNTMVRAILDRRRIESQAHNTPGYVATWIARDPCVYRGLG